jgi:carbon monoxide dehydrogenase subunit G
MKLSAREDIDAPIAVVFDRLADFDGWTRAAMRRGAEVQRRDALPRPGPGMSWALGFLYRGKHRSLALSLDEMVPPERLGFSGHGPNLEGGLSIELIEMAPRRTRMTVKLEVRPRTLVARLFIQSLKLGRGKVEARFRTRVAQAASEIDGRERGVA